MVGPDLPPFTALHFTSHHFTNRKYPSRYTQIYPLHCTTLHIISPTINTLHGTSQFTPFTVLHFTSLHFTNHKYPSRNTQIYPLHCTTLHITSPIINTLHGTPQFTPLHCTTLHFTLLHFNFWIIFNPSHLLQLTTLITFPTLFLKVFGLQWRAPKIWGDLG